MPSQIDVTKPVTGSPTTQSVRDNFTEAKTEIDKSLRQSTDYVSTTGTGTAFLADFQQNITLTDGVRITVKAHADFPSGPTLNVDGTGAKSIKVYDNQNYLSGMVEQNQLCDFMYDSTLDVWVLLNPYPKQAGSFDTNKTITISGDVAGSVVTNFASNPTINVTASQSLGLQAYPVGSLYLSTVNTDPSTIFGGTWVRFGLGKALVGMKTVSDPEYALGVEGGYDRMTLTTDNLPPHTHNTTMTIHENRSSSSGSNIEGTNGPSISSKTITSSSVGSGHSFDNRMPYITIAIWKRTA